MIKVKAIIRLYPSDVGRKTPFLSGYRPLFNFVAQMKTSGMITLGDREEFCPGDQGIVEVDFVNEEYLGAIFGIGTSFTFGEGKAPVGEGEIKEILSNGHS